MAKPNEIYRKFSLETMKYKFPIRYGYDWFCSALNKIYEAKTSNVDWLGFEAFIRDVLASDKLTNKQRCSVIRDGVVAFTRRG